MTKFDKTQFTYHGGYLMYGNRFVARFKYKGAISKAQFLKQLIKHHTVEEYFHKLEIDHVAPLTILEKADPKWSEAVMQKFRQRIMR